jgi:hypothetical protein
LPGTQASTYTVMSEAATAMNRRPGQRRGVGKVHGANEDGSAPFHGSSGRQARHDSQAGKLPERGLPFSCGSQIRDDLRVEPAEHPPHHPAGQSCVPGSAPAYAGAGRRDSGHRQAVRLCRGQRALP